jgi:hypothetical protein
MTAMLISQQVQLLHTRRVLTRSRRWTLERQYSNRLGAATQNRSRFLFGIYRLRFRPDDAQAGTLQRMRIQRCPSSFTFTAQQRAGANARVWRASEVRWWLPSPLTTTLSSFAEYTQDPLHPLLANDYWTRIRPIDDSSATLLHHQWKQQPHFAE